MFLLMIQYWCSGGKSSFILPSGRSEINNRTASLKPVGIRGFANGHFSRVEAPHAVMLKLESGSRKDTRYTTVLCVCLRWLVVMACCSLHG